MTQSLKDERPYATALGFYLGDRVEHTTGQIGHICEVFGSDSHAVGVKMPNGSALYTSDEKLTRLGDE